MTFFDTVFLFSVIFNEVVMFVLKGCGVGFVCIDNLWNDVCLYWEVMGWSLFVLTGHGMKFVCIDNIVEWGLFVLLTGRGMRMGYMHSMTLSKRTIYPDFEDLDATVDRLNKTLKENPIPGRNEEIHLKKLNWSKCFSFFLFFWKYIHD